MSSKPKPQTIAHVRVLASCWHQGQIRGEVVASDYTWEFQWRFQRKELIISPSLGRALIKEPLGRFLEQQDYQLEPGGDYFFTIRAKF